MNPYTKPAVLTADRSLPRRSLVMMMRSAEVDAAPLPRLPEGYAFRLYEPGDAVHWARIATVVEEFLTEEEAEASFTQHFLPEEDELLRRCVFVLAPDGQPVATAMAWTFEEGGQRYGRVHWICNDPAHQGKGIGRAIVLWAVNRLKELEPGLDAYLDTQTWSHKAIGLYLRLGFHPVRESHPVLRHINEYRATAEILRDMLPGTVMEMFMEQSVD